MITSIIMTSGAILVLILVYFIGFFVGVCSALDMMDADYQRDIDGVDYDDLYCFQCEMEMSVKEIDGQLHCGNCGLRH